MKNPRFENVTAMENNASGEDDRQCNLRLWANGYTTAWLVVADVAPDNTAPAYRYTHQVGRSHKEIDRAEAQRLIDKEWGR